MGKVGRLSQEKEPDPRHLGSQALWDLSPKGELLLLLLSRFSRVQLCATP